ncbi:Crp/Fnr family transcriptional regulator [Bacillus benzoevorans]|uniref:CRP/FNR family transcriptional regulator n=1 Tax=Bacillus benzoevorans TaxID=1456 RepID=A0A7X0HV12_9BACI|nr:Crp/Fnr family transcriptional regulator [Bacillus benzoevorans]MBB6447409.1 CRP/FNR family transcriptional regulator [Bacillus benzoevorans]
MNGLSGLNCLNGLSSKKLLELGKKCFRKQYDKGSFLYKPGETNDYVYIVEKGKFLAYRLTNCGKPCASRRLNEGEIIGEEDILSCPIRDSYVESITDSQCILISRMEYEELLYHYPEFTRSRLEGLSIRIKETEQMMQAIAYSSVSKRLLLLLSEVGKQTGQNSNQEIKFHSDMSHHDLAAMIGSTRETVTSNLSSLQREGVIAVNGKQISIKKDKLERYL